MSKFGNIINGWKNLAFPNEEVEKEAIKRLEICVGSDTKEACQFFSSKFTDHCRLCGCPIDAKVRSIKPTNKCKIGKWGPYKEVDKETK